MAERRQLFTGAHTEVPYVSKSKIKILSSGDKKGGKKPARPKKQVEDTAAPAEE